MTVNTPETRLKALGLELPHAAAPAANYVPFVVEGDQCVISGQLPMWNGELRHTGHLGADVDLATGQEAARLCTLNILAQLKVAVGGDLTRVRRCVRLGGFVACTPDFTDQPKVINGASDLMVEIFGNPGRHARFAVGAPALPLGAAVEVDAVFRVEN